MTPQDCNRRVSSPDHQEDRDRWKNRRIQISAANWGGGRFKPWCPEQTTFPWEYFGYDGQGAYTYDFRPCAWYCYRYAHPEGIPFMWRWPKPTDTECIEYYLKVPPGWDGSIVTGQANTLFDSIKDLLQLVFRVEIGLTPRIAIDDYPGGVDQYDADVQLLGRKIADYSYNSVTLWAGISDTYAEWNWIARLISPALEQVSLTQGRGPFSFEKYETTAQWLGCEGSGSVADGTFVPGTPDGGVVPIVRATTNWWQQCNLECREGTPAGESIPIDPDPETGYQNLPPADPGFPAIYTPAGHAQPPSEILAFLNRVVIHEIYTGDVMPAPGGWRYGRAAGKDYKSDKELHEYLYNTNDPTGEPDTLKWPPPGVTPEMIITPESLGLVQTSDGVWLYPEQLAEGDGETSGGETSGGGYP